MNYFLIINGKRLKHYSVIILTALVTAWLLYVQNLSFAVFSQNESAKALYRGKEGVALTFNIAWGNEKAEPILDVLIENEVKSATFFISGSWAEMHPHIVDKIVKAGYEIGLLGYEYVDYEELDDKKIRQDILRAEEALRKLGVKHEKILRAPNGLFDKRLLKIAEQMGYTVVHWSIDSNDWRNPGTTKIVENVSQAKKGDIVLLHASDSAKQTAVALPDILKKYNEKNLKLVTVTEMLVEGKAETKEIN